MPLYTHNAMYSSRIIAIGIIIWISRGNFFCTLLILAILREGLLTSQQVTSNIASVLLREGLLTSQKVSSTIAPVTHIITKRV